MLDWIGPWRLVEHFLCAADLMGSEQGSTKGSAVHCALLTVGSAQLGRLMRGPNRLLYLRL